MKRAAIKPKEAQKQMKVSVIITAESQFWRHRTFVRIEKLRFWCVYFQTVKHWADEHSTYLGQTRPTSYQYAIPPVNHTLYPKAEIENLTKLWNWFKKKKESQYF